MYIYIFVLVSFCLADGVWGLLGTAWAPQGDYLGPILVGTC